MVDVSQLNSLINMLRETEIPHSKISRTDRTINRFLKDRTRILHKLDMMAFKREPFDSEVLKKLQKLLIKYQTIIMKTEKPLFKFIKYRGLKRLLNDSIAGMEQLIKDPPRPESSSPTVRFRTEHPSTRPSSAKPQDFLELLKSFKTEQEKKMEQYAIKLMDLRKQIEDEMKPFL